LAHSDQVFRLTAPSPVVVQTELGLDLGSSLYTGKHRADGGLDHLFPGVWRRTCQRLPDLWPQLVFREKFERFGMKVPKCKELDGMLLIGEDLLLEGIDMLLSPIVGTTTDA